MRVDEHGKNHEATVAETVIKIGVKFTLDKASKKFRVGALTHGIAKLSVVLCTKT
jgi:hypothetical protein